MLDELRKQAEETSFEDELYETQEQSSGLFKYIHLPEGNFLGLSAPQRFIIALILLLMVFLGGIAGLLITGKVVPTF